MSCKKHHGRKIVGVEQQKKQQSLIRPIQLENERYMPKRVRR